MGGGKSQPISFSQTDGTDWLYPGGKPKATPATVNPGMPRAIPGYDVRQMLRDRIMAMRGGQNVNPLATNGLFAPSRLPAVPATPAAAAATPNDVALRLARLEAPNKYFMHNNNWYSKDTGQQYMFPAGTSTAKQVQIIDNLQDYRAGVR